MSTKLKRIIAGIITSAVLVIAGVTLSPVLAIDWNGCEVYDTEGNCLDDFYIKNDIDYDPSVPVCTANGSPLSDSSDEDKKAVEIGAERDYVGRPVINTPQIEAIKNNQSTYEAAAKDSNIPWQMLAAIHLKASGLQLENPENGLGVYQIPGKSYPTGPIDKAAFLEQSKEAAKLLKLAEPDLTTEIKQVDTVKAALYSYLVGNNTLYSQQAKDLGFSNDYDGSPEIMNKADEKRDPSSKEADNWGTYDKKTSTLKYPSGNEYGAYPIFATISGISLANCGGLIEGGMNLEQAKDFMDTYLKIDQGDPNGDGKYLAGFWVCKSKTDNCVTFSGYFVNKYTSLRSANVNGGEVVETMQAYNPDMPVGREPRPYAVFSTKQGTTQCSSGACGHTGVVLGVNKEDDTIIVGEAAWCRPGFTGAHVYQLSRWNGTGYLYAYTDAYLNKNISTVAP